MREAISDTPGLTLALYPGTAGAVLINKHRDQHADQQQQYDAQENDQQFATILGVATMVRVFHIFLLSTAGSALA